MKITKMTEKECRELKIPFLKTKEELLEFIESLDILNDDYGTSAYAMSLAGVAAFNYIAYRFGTTGFQASCADLDMLRRIRLMEGPFIIIDGSNLLYPQYNLEKRVKEFINNEEVQKWLKEEAQKMLEENKSAHPDVINHWKKLVEAH